MIRLKWLLIPLLLVMAAAGAGALNDDPVWADEYFSIRDSAGSTQSPIPPWEVWHDLGARNPWHVPGFFLLLNGWGRLVGWTPPALRVLSLLAGLLAVAWTYRLGRDFLSAKAGLFAAAILSTSAFFIYYTHELRMYTLFALFTALTLWAYLTLMHGSAGNQRGRGKPRPYAGAALFIGVVGLLYTHYFAALPLVAIGVYHLICGALLWRSKTPPSAKPNHTIGAQHAVPLRYATQSRHMTKAVFPSARVWWGSGAALTLAGLTFLPWLSILLEGLQRAAAAEELHARALSAGEALGRLLFLFSSGGILLLAAALVGLVGALAGRVTGGKVWRFVFFALMVIGAALAANEVLQLMHGGRLRYLMGALPLLALLAGVGLAAWGRAGWLLLALWLVGGLNAIGQPDFVDVDGGAARYPSQRVGQAIDEQAWASDLVVNITGGLGGYFSGAGEIDFGSIPVSYVFISGREALSMRLAVIDGEIAEQPALDLAFSRDRLWLAAARNRLPAAFAAFEAALTAQYTYCRTALDQPDLSVALYARSAVCCLSDDAPPLLRFGEGIALTGVDLPASAVGALPVALLWTVTGEVAPHAYSVSIQLINATGEKVAQADYGLQAQMHTCSRAEIDVSGLPPGAYQARVTVYAWQTGERLPGIVLATGETGDLLPIGSVTMN